MTIWNHLKTKPTKTPNNHTEHKLSHHFSFATDEFLTHFNKTANDLGFSKNEIADSLIRLQQAYDDSKKLA